MPERLALCDLGAPSLGGALVSAQCCVASFTHGSRLLRCLCFGTSFFTLSAIPILWMIQCYHLSFSYDVAELASRSLCLVFFLVCGCCFAVLLFSLFGSSGMVRAIWSLYWSCVSSTFAAHLLWRWIHRSVLNDLAEAKRRWTEKKVCFVNSLFFSENKTQTQNQT